MWLGGGMITEFNDNINLDPNKGESDIILRPNLYCRILKPLTEQNQLNFIGRGGFTRYLKHPQYNANFLTISPDTAISLTCYVREIECVLTDQLSYLHEKYSEYLSHTQHNSSNLCLPYREHSVASIVNSERLEGYKYDPLADYQSHIHPIIFDVALRSKIQS